MKGTLALVLHAHLPFVRHPEHARSLEESWFYEAITESYIPLLRIFQGWREEGLPVRIALSVTPTLGGMLEDELLRSRYKTHLDNLVKLAELEVHRTLFKTSLHGAALFYLEHLEQIRAWYHGHGCDLIPVLRQLNEAGTIELMAGAATHAVLPLLRTHPPSLRAQVTTGLLAHQRRFERKARGFWLPECAWASEVDAFLAQGGGQWFVCESHGLMDAHPPPRYATLAPLITPSGLAAFGRDTGSARQVWSRSEGYPGDPYYRDFYRDIGHDLDLDYVQEFLSVKGRRGFTGIKYHRITGPGSAKEVYDRAAALGRVNEHARHFVECRMAQFSKAHSAMEHPILVCPYDAELFGHWWFEGPEFVDAVVREALVAGLTVATPSDYLDRYPQHQAGLPADSSWGERGYWHVWLNEKNHWITARLGFAQERMSRLARLENTLSPELKRALRQAARELLLAQASDWPFIIRTGTSPDYAARRARAHLLRFWKLCDGVEGGHVDARWLEKLELADNIFPEVDCSQWI